MWLFPWFQAWSGAHSESESRSVESNSLQPHGPYSSWNSWGQNTGIDSCSLLQGIFPTQGSNPGLLHCRQILYQLSHKGSPRILEWVAYPFSSGSSQTRNRTRVSCIAGGFFTNWCSINICWVNEWMDGSNVVLVPPVQQFYRYKSTFLCFSNSILTEVLWGDAREDDESLLCTKTYTLASHL